MVEEITQRACIENRGGEDLKNRTSVPIKRPRRVRRFKKKNSNKILCMRIILLIFDKEKRKVL